MDELSYKIRIAALWLLAIVAFVGYRILAVSEQAREVSLLGNQDFASYLLVMMTFAFLSLILPSRLNRLLNMIAGGIFLVLQSIMLADGAFGYPSGTFNAMTGVTLVGMASIVWLAFRWPRREHVLRNKGSDVGIEEPASTAHAA
ncbi:MAG TPA: hypothetical protein VFP41_06715 [Actinomycetota bacterium]|nr:hypothetical protein [Actinomycetota bacterium]